ncbi:MAG: FAD-dependent oxidoreductase [Dongiaceae bacterium]
MQQARVIVVGGGCVGAGILYGLARRGWTDCVLLERAQIAGGSTRLAGGFIPTYVRSDAASRMINRTIEIYKGLEADTGQAVGWHPCGQMRIARQPGRLDEYRSYMNVAEAIGAEARLLTAREALEIWPLIGSPEGILGALYHPGDGWVSPTDVTMALLKGARDRGARVQEQARVTAISARRGGGWTLATTAGEWLCEQLVLATGTYARDTGALLGLELPCMPVVVQYWITDAVPELAARRRQGLPEMPIMRDEHFLGYMREEGDALLFGTYERSEDLQLFGVDGVPESFTGEPMPPDLDAHAWGMERAAEIVPAFARAGIRSNIRGPMQMTADGMPLVGPAWGRHGLWLAEGVPGGILWGGTIGHSLSEWIVEGGTSIDMNELDPRRFGAYATKEWIALKAVELWGAHSDLILPGQELPAARPARTHPAYDRLTALGAVWGAANGWEVPVWYAPAGMPAVDAPGYRDTPASRQVAEEVLAVRGGVGLVEASAATKLEVSGREASAWLDQVLATPLPAVGSVGAGYLLLENGGVRSAFAVCRLAEDLFYLVSGARTERLDLDALWRLLPDGGGVALRNVTMERGCFAITGPRARDLLAGLVDADLGNAAFPPGTVRTLAIGLAEDVRLVRSSSTGELGWELHHPIAGQRHLLDRLLAAGARHGLRLVGQRALNPLRLDKSYPAVGPDMNAEIDALAAGLGPQLAPDKGPFVGRAAIRRLAAGPPARRLATLLIATSGASVLGHEGVYRAGRLAGRITSGAFSPTFGEDVALALLPAALAVPGTELTVPVLETVCAARVVADSPYDPEGLRLAM